ncbi:MAG: hypothetical protein IJR85_11090 [Synergistaceae bacterium]|nr:hypothetical protein [Synergistaceae bacterium]
MMRIAADLHTHTIASGHAYGTIREMAFAASEKNLDMLGITEHAPGIPGTVDRIYFCNLSVIPRELYGNGSLSLGQKDLDRLDYAIAGIHTVCYEDAVRERNTSNLIECMKNSKVCSFMKPEARLNCVDNYRVMLVLNTDAEMVHNFIRGWND